MPVVAMAFRLEDMERKLLRLALSPSAQGGEITTSATKLINALRARGVESGTIENALESNGAENMAPVISKPDWGMTMLSFGKHKGEMLMEFPPSYLRWVLHWINETLTAQPRRCLANGHAIEQFFQQAKSRTLNPYACLYDPSGNNSLPPRTLEYLAKGASVGSRHNELFAAACQFRDCGYDVNETARQCVPRAVEDGLDEAEAAKTVASVFRHAPTRPTSED